MKGRIYISLLSLLLVSSCSGDGKDKYKNLILFSEKGDDESCNSEDNWPVYPQVIYGKDDRLEIYETCDKRHVQMAKSTLALIDSSQVVNYKDLFEIQTLHFGQRYKLCPGEPFYDQGTAAFCSGFLVTPKIIITAGHCIPSQNRCDQASFVFGYGKYTPDHNPAIVHSDDVYNCEKLIQSEEQGGNDYAIIQLDRRVVGRVPLLIRHEGTIALDSPLVVIGHPSGLPTKVAAGAKVRSVSEFYFTSNLDTYGGNSGSPVFNNISGVVEGILIRGEIDYIFDSENNCRLSSHCSDGSCSGEDVTKITEILKHIPNFQ